jgi:hypothetical protein
VCGGGVRALHPSDYERCHPTLNSATTPLKGCIAEYGSPAALLANGDGHLRYLVNALGEGAAAELTAKAGRV